MAAATSAAANVPRQCLAELADAEADAEIDLGRRCPRLSGWLREQGYADALQPPIDEIDEAGQAREALRLLDRQEPQAAAMSVDRERLDWIVGRIRRTQPDDAPPTWWSRFREWLQAWLPETDWNIGDRLEELGQKLGWVGHVVYWLGVLLLLAGLGSVVWALVRLLRRHGFAAVQRSATGQHPGDDAAGPPRGLDAIRALAPREQPSALLRLTIAALREAGMLPRSPGKTDAELATTLRERHLDEVERFRRIAGCAERCVYGGQVPGSEELERCFADAGRLTGQREIGA